MVAGATRCLVAAATAALVSAAGCSGDASGGSIGHVARERASGPSVRVEGHASCPSALGRAQDVRNTSDALGSRLVPDGRAPVGGLVCDYVAARLVRTVGLREPDAARLAAALGRISLAPPSGEFACPADLPGNDTVIALRYGTGRTVDLWYARSGCQTVDNGYVLVFEGANKSFYDGFLPVFEELDPAAR